MKEFVTRTQALVLFLILMSGFLLYGGFVKHESAVNSKETAINIYNTCTARATAIDRLNAQARAFIEIEKDNPFQFQGADEKAIIDRRIEIYTAAILDKPDCEPLKP